MLINFWRNLPRPFTAMAPMDDVTDNVFRQVILEAGRPDVFFTEFANADGLIHGANGIPLRKLNFTEAQHPIVAQIWGTDPVKMEKAAKIAKNLNFDGIDINMGCPVKEVVKRGAGAGLIGEYKLAGDLIKAVKRGAGGLPVSVKTRLGKNENIAKDWITFLLKQEIAALTIHARIAKQMSKGKADWEEIGKIIELRNGISPSTLIIGNGDVKSYSEVLLMRERYGVDGVMIGRGVFTNPWVFNKSESIKHKKVDYINLLCKHMDLFESVWGDSKNFEIIKKFFKMYIKGFPGASKLRIKMMRAKNFSEVREIIGVI